MPILQQKLYFRFHFQTNSAFEFTYSHKSRRSARFQNAVVLCDRIKDLRNTNVTPSPSLGYLPTFKIEKASNTIAYWSRVQPRNVRGLSVLSLTTRGWESGGLLAQRIQEYGIQFCSVRILFFSRVCDVSRWGVKRKSGEEKSLDGGDLLFFCRALVVVLYKWDSIHFDVDLYEKINWESFNKRSMRKFRMTESKFTRV